MSNEESSWLVLVLVSSDLLWWPIAHDPDVQDKGRERSQISVLCSRAV